jgi:dihydroorotase-like cyclic amidohydrolase
MRNDAPFDLAVTGGMVVIPPAGPRPLTVGIMGQRIAALVDPGEPVSARAVVDASGQLVLPGAIDPHVHIGYSGYQGMPVDALASHFETESASALIGGVTSIVVTYRNADPYDGLFSLMREAGEKCSRIDFAYSLGITNDEHLHRIRRYHETLGVTSFKFYMAYRGEEARATGNVYNRYDDGLLFEGMEQIAQVPGGIVMVHPENVEIINRLRARLQAGGRNDLAAWSDSRPPFTEAENVRRALYLAEQVGCEVYIPHLSSAEALEAVIEHRARRTTPVTVETCPHYLTHTKHSACGALAKVNPPLREAEDMDRLWQALAQGDVDTIGTDHCAVTRDTKRPDIWGAVPGIHRHGHDAAGAAAGRRRGAPLAASRGGDRVVQHGARLRPVPAQGGHRGRIRRRPGSRRPGTHADRHRRRPAVAFGLQPLRGTADPRLADRDDNAGGDRDARR